MDRNEDLYFDAFLRYLRILNRRKFYIIICAFAFSVVTVFYAKKLPNIYRASTTIILPSGLGGSQTTGLSQALSNLAVSQMSVLGLKSAGGPGGNLVSILKSRSLAEEVARYFNLTKGTSVEEAALTIKGNINAADSEGMIVISYESTNPKQAADIANYYPLALRNILDKNFKAYRDSLRNRIKKTEALSRDYKTMFENYKRQFSDLQALYTLHQSTIQQYDLARLEEDTYSNFTVLDSALVPNAPIRPDRRKIALAGSLIGLAIGILLAFALEALDNRIYEKEVIEDKIGMPILGTLNLNWRGKKNLADAVNISGQEKIIRKNIESFFAGKNIHTRKIVFTSFEENLEKAILIYKIGQALFEGGKKFLVINYNTNPHNREIYKEISQKLTAKYSSTFDIKEAADGDHLENLPEYDYILVDAPSGIMSPLIFDLVEWGDITFPVVKIGSTFTKELALHKESLEKITDHQVKAIVIAPLTSSPLSRIRKILSHKIT